MDKTQETGGEEDVKEFLFLGAPLLDIIAQCRPETLGKYGLKSDDCIRETDQQEALFRLLFDDPDSQMSAGGSSQNSARIAQWTLGNRGRVFFAGCVGEDIYAKTMLDRLQSEGVEALYISLPGDSTGICACLLSSDGDRSMCARLGAAGRIAEHHLREENVRERVRGANSIFVEGYLFGHSPDVLIAVAETCTNNQVLSISLSAEYVCRDHAETLARVLPRVDVLFGNEAEVKVLARSLNLGDFLSVEDLARILASRDRAPGFKPRIVVITRGPNSVLVARGSESLLSFPVPEVPKVVDGVGCGDAMAGAFLAVYVLTDDACLAAKTGISAAAEIAQVTGCRPTRKTLYPPTMATLHPK